MSEQVERRLEHIGKMLRDLRQAQEKATQPFLVWSLSLDLAAEVPWLLGMLRKEREQNRTERRETEVQC